MIPARQSHELRLTRVSYIIAPRMGSLNPFTPALIHTCNQGLPLPLGPQTALAAILPQPVPPHMPPPLLPQHLLLPRSSRSPPYIPFTPAATRHHRQGPASAPAALRCCCCCLPPRTWRLPGSTWSSMWVMMMMMMMVIDGEARPAGEVALSSTPSRPPGSA